MPQLGPLMWMFSCFMVILLVFKFIVMDSYSKDSIFCGNSKAVKLSLMFLW